MKYLLIVLVVGVVSFGVIFLLTTDFLMEFTTEDPAEEDSDVVEEDDETESDEEEEEEKEEDEEKAKLYSEEIIGKSVEGRDIVSHRYGGGDDRIIFVGGIHGGYSWGTSLLSYEIIDHLEDNFEIIPENVEVIVIPVLNPDGLSKVVEVDGRFDPSDVIGDTVVGRFNANSVDINRNFDCNWESEGVWQNKVIDAGSEPFSEPESEAIKDFIKNSKPEAVVVYFGAAGSVYTSTCYGDVLNQTEELMDVYADASGYSAEGIFDSYKITGDMADWLSKIDIPAISVLLDSHDSSEWDKNRRGLEAVLEMYGN